MKIYLLLTTLLLVGCGSSAKTSNNTSFYIKDDGRLLASQCAGCHGTDGYSKSKWDSIANEDELLEEFREFSSSHIMGVQAKGYSNEEVILIQNYFLKLKKEDD